MLGHTRKMSRPECFADTLKGYGGTPVMTVPTVPRSTVAAMGCRRGSEPQPVQVHLRLRGNEGRVDLEEAEMEPLTEGRFSRVPPFRPAPDSASVLAALKLLQEADRPVIVAGGGVRGSGAAAELVALAEALQIPVATSLNGKDSFRGNHPLSVGVVGTYSRESANRVVNRADLVCFIGSEP